MTTAVTLSSPLGSASSVVGHGADMVLPLKYMIIHDGPKCSVCGVVRSVAKQMTWLSKWSSWTEETFVDWKDARSTAFWRWLVGFTCRGVTRAGQGPWAKEGNGK